MIRGLYSNVANGGKWGAWHCATFAAFTLAIFIGINVAGCGGSGGGQIAPIANPTVNITLRDINGVIVRDTAVTFNGVLKLTNSSGMASYVDIKPGTYSLRFTINNQTTVTTIAVSADSVQNFVAVQGSGTVSAFNIAVRGRVVVNVPDDSTTARCNSSSQGVTDTVVVRVRDVNANSEQPIVASYVKPKQDPNTPVAQRGQYQFLNIPRPGTYRIEVRAATNSNTSWAGVSATFTVVANQSINLLDVCTNTRNIPPGVPGETPTPVPTFTFNGTGTPPTTPTATPTNTPTATPTATPTSTATATATSTATATATSTATATATSTATATATSTSTSPAPTAPGG